MDFFDVLWDSIKLKTPKLLLAAAILVGGWVVARVVSRVVFSLLVRTNLDQWAQRRLGFDTRGKYGHRVERFVARISFYAVVLVALVLAFDTLAIQTASEPFRNLVTGIGEAAPKLLLAVVIVALAFFLGKLVSFSVIKALEATNLDNRLGRVEGLDPNRVRLSTSVGGLVFWSILVIGVIQGLDALEMNSLVEPLQGALNEFAAILPDLIAATVLVLLGLVIARFVGTLCADVLSDVGFDQLFYKVVPAIEPSEDGEADATVAADASGETEGATETDSDASDSVQDTAASDPESAESGDEATPDTAESKRPRTPSSVAGQAITVLIALMALLQAFSILELERFALLLDTFVSDFLPNLAIAAVIVLAGVWAGNWVKIQIDGLTSEHDTGLVGVLGSLGRAAVLVFAVGAGLQQVGVAPELIRTAFAILFGALALALALAFGLGGREVAADVVKKEYDRHGTTTKKRPKAKG